MKADGHKVHRPAVFFLTDGEPTDDDAAWKQAFSELADPAFQARPNVIPFGVADAQKKVLDQIVHPVREDAVVPDEGRRRPRSSDLPDGGDAGRQRHRVCDVSQRHGCQRHVRTA